MVIQQYWAMKKSVASSRMKIGICDVTSPPSQWRSWRRHQLCTPLLSTELSKHWSNGETLQYEAWRETAFYNYERESTKISRLWCSIKERSATSVIQMVLVRLHPNKHGFSVNASATDEIAIIRLQQATTVCHNLPQHLSRNQRVLIRHRPIRCYGCGNTARHTIPSPEVPSITFP